jgi:hypothetical protein
MPRTAGGKTKKMVKFFAAPLFFIPVTSAALGGYLTGYDHFSKPTSANFITGLPSFIASNLKVSHNTNHS